MAETGIWGEPLPPIARCDRCGRDIRHGRPYVMVRPGVFAHRGPCLLVPPSKPERSTPGDGR